MSKKTVQIVNEWPLAKRRGCQTAVHSVVHICENSRKLTLKIPWNIHFTKICTVLLPLFGFLIWFIWGYREIPKKHRGFILWVEKGLVDFFLRTQRFDFAIEFFGIFLPCVMICHFRILILSIKKSDFRINYWAISWLRGHCKHLIRVSTNIDKWILTHHFQWSGQHLDKTISDIKEPFSCFVYTIHLILI